MKKYLPALLVLCCYVGLARPVFAAPFVWTELGSAGNLPATANITTGTGSLLQILGNLTVVTQVDLFQIRISDFMNFSATTEDDGFVVDDPQLFLFNSSGRAVYMNDDGAGLGSQSRLPSGNPLGPSAAGLYYLGIGWFDNEPFSAAGLMFVDTSLDPEAIGGPGPGGLSPLSGWNNNAIGRPDLPTAYSIRLTGAEFAAASTSVPEAPALATMAAGLAAVAGLKWLWKRTA